MKSEAMTRPVKYNTTAPLGTTNARSIAIMRLGTLMRLAVEEWHEPSISLIKKMCKFGVEFCIAIGDHDNNIGEVLDWEMSSDECVCFFATTEDDCPIWLRKKYLDEPEGQLLE